MPKVLNKKTDRIPPDAVYVGRPSKWGNPLPMQNEADRDFVCDAYVMFYYTNKLDECIEELRGKDLVCWCAPERCHADFLLKMANK